MTFKIFTPHARSSSLQTSWDTQILLPLATIITTCSLQKTIISVTIMISTNRNPSLLKKKSKKLPPIIPHTHNYNSKIIIIPIQQQHILNIWEWRLDRTSIRRLPFNCLTPLRLLQMFLKNRSAQNLQRLPSNFSNKKKSICQHSPQRSKNHP